MAKTRASRTRSRRALREPHVKGDTALGPPCESRPEPGQRPSADYLLHMTTLSTVAGVTGVALP